MVGSGKDHGTGTGWNVAPPRTRHKVPNTTLVPGLASLVSRKLVAPAHGVPVSRCRGVREAFGGCWILAAGLSRGVTGQRR